MRAGQEPKLPLEKFVTRSSLINLVVLVTGLEKPKTFRGRVKAFANETTKFRFTATEIHKFIICHETPLHDQANNDKLADCPWRYV